MERKIVLGIDIGGTNIRAGVINNFKIEELASIQINSKGSVDEVFNELIEVTDKVINDDISAIGIGVPSVVDTRAGIVYDVQNIPSWKEVAIGQRMQKLYNLPVLVNNDANCFALGEYHFGKGKGTKSMVGVNIGTGLGAGIIINGKLYCGPNCGAGEFGMIGYKDKVVEYYASGQFFKNVYNVNGKDVFERAKNGDNAALKMFDELGFHLGNAFKNILYTMDPEMIVIGGSLKNAWEFYSASMKKQLDTFAFSRSVSNVKIHISELENCGVLGAAALHFDDILN